MQEAFLHFIWQYQYFNKPKLTTTDDVPVNVIHPGIYNTDAGPDFREARIQMGGMEWRGNVELHVRSSDWAHHNHDQDAAYNNVVLHVVWEHNQEVRRKDNTAIPTVELQGLVSEKVIFEYKKLVNSPCQVPCENQLNDVQSITWVSTLDKVLMERLSAKAMVVQQLLHKNNQSWEETAYQLLAKNFGFKINSEPFFTLAESLPFKLLRKHADSLRQIEAMLFGQAGFLQDDPADDYQVELCKEYTFLKQKYELQERLTAVQWRLLRLRPANFPSVRLAQFAQVIFHNHSLFHSLIEVESVKQLKGLLQAKQTEYWKAHYQFGKVAKKPMPALGSASIDNVAINTIAPLLVAYGQYTDEDRYIDKALAMLQEIKPENNKIIGYWQQSGVSVTSAFDSQALIQLYNEYCIKHRCLSCHIGVSLIRKK